MTGPNRDDGATPGLVWGIKESFLRYVAAIPDGLCELFGGVEPYSPGRFLFPGTDREGEYDGTLAVTAYAGLLSVTVAHPWVQGGDGRERLVVDAGPGDPEPIAVAELRRTAPSGIARAAYAATLTAEGSRWLGDVYPAGIEMDNVEIL